MKNIENLLQDYLKLPETDAAKKDAILEKVSTKVQSTDKMDGFNDFFKKTYDKMITGFGKNDDARELKEAKARFEFLSVLKENKVGVAADLNTKVFAALRLNPDKIAHSTKDDIEDDIEEDGDELVTISSAGEDSEEESKSSVGDSAGEDSGEEKDDDWTPGDAGIKDAILDEIDSRISAAASKNAQVGNNVSPGNNTSPGAGGTTGPATGNDASTDDDDKDDTLAPKKSGDDDGDDKDKKPDDKKDLDISFFNEGKLYKMPKDISGIINDLDKRNTFLAKAIACDLGHPDLKDNEALKNYVNKINLDNSQFKSWSGVTQPEQLKKIIRKEVENILAQAYLEASGGGIYDKLDKTVQSITNREINSEYKESLKEGYNGKLSKVEPFDKALEKLNDPEKFTFNDFVKTSIQNAPQKLKKTLISATTAKPIVTFGVLCLMPPWPMGVAVAVGYGIGFAAYKIACKAEKQLKDKDNMPAQIISKVLLAPAPVVMEVLFQVTRVVANVGTAIASVAKSLASGEELTWKNFKKNFSKNFDEMITKTPFKYKIEGEDIKDKVLSALPFVKKVFNLDVGEFLFGKKENEEIKINTNNDRMSSITSDQIKKINEKYTADPSVKQEFEKAMPYIPIKHKQQFNKALQANVPNDPMADLGVPAISPDLAKNQNPGDLADSVNKTTPNPSTPKFHKNGNQLL
jgi:hypothetical protein